ncbi:MAG: response regulator, partial [Candidatus Omnitrophica bacterium]|nr:response regulator [Candidatus Omnitrophota bacterium]
MNKMQKKVLLVDDEPDYLKIIKRRLEANNYQVTTATNGRESIEQAKKVLPDIIIMDIMMPELDGIA